MARMARKDVIDDDQPGMYHCINRCVRRAFLCGDDPVSGQNFDHRKGLIRKRLEFLAGVFAVDVCGYTVMSNHFHLVLRNRPDIAGKWSDKEVAQRWWRLFPGRRDKDGAPAKPYEHELKALMADPKQLEELRGRLSSISWLMRCTCENVARAANKEDGCTGRFWEGRFKCQPLLDEAAVLACSVYVDLNPIRAGIAKRPETSEFTSVHDRIAARNARRPSAKRSGTLPYARRGADGWLSPVELAKDLEAANRPAKRRASSKGFLPLKLDEYLALVDWTGRQVRHDKRGAIPKRLAPILDRLQVSGELWVETVKNFGRWFRRVAGRKESLAKEAERRDVRWLQGTSHCLAAFG